MTTDNADTTEMVGSIKQLDLNRSVSLAPLTYLAEGEDITVGRQDIDSYCILQADGAALLRQLEAGETPHAAQEWYRSTYGEPVDIVEFLDTIDALGFIAAGESQPTRPGLQRLGRRALFTSGHDRVRRGHRRPAWSSLLAIITCCRVIATFSSAST